MFFLGMLFGLLIAVPIILFEAWYVRKSSVLLTRAADYIEKSTQEKGEIIHAPSEKLEVLDEMFKEDV